MDELMERIRKLRLTKDDVIMEAECVDQYGEWIHISLMGYGYEDLMAAAERM